MAVSLRSKYLRLAASDLGFALESVVGDVKRRLDDFNRQKQSLDAEIERLRSSKEANLAKIALKAASDSELSALTRQVNEKKQAAADLIRALNESLCLVNQRLGTSYSVPENAENTNEVL